MQITVIEVDIDQFLRDPAVTHNWEYYLVKDGKIVGELRLGSKYNGEVSAFIDKTTSVKEFVLENTGIEEKHLNVVSLRFSELTGMFERLGVSDDLKTEALDDTFIIEKFGYDFGFLPKRYENGAWKIEGYVPCRDRHSEGDENVSV